MVFKEDFILRNAADAQWYMEYYSLRFPGYRFIPHQKLRQYPYWGRDGECLFDSAGTGGVSIPNHLHHRTSDLWMEGNFILDFFRQNYPRELICTQCRYLSVEGGK